MDRHAQVTPLLPLEPETPTLQGYITRAQLAQHLRVAESTIARYQRVLDHPLPVHRIGLQPLYDLAEVERWFATRPNLMHGGVPGTPTQEALLDRKYAPRGVR